MKIMRKSQLRDIAFRIVDYHAAWIKYLSKYMKYSDIMQAQDRGYIYDYVYRCRELIKKADSVLEFAGEPTYAKEYNLNVKYARYIGQKNMNDADYYLDLTDSATIPKVKFDCIVATAVINMCINPYVALENLKHMLTDNGILILTIGGPVLSKGSIPCFFSSYGCRCMCEEIFTKVFKVMPYGDLNHGIYALIGSGRPPYENISRREKDKITLITGLCCLK